MNAPVVPAGGCDGAVAAESDVCLRWLRSQSGVAPLGLVDASPGEAAGTLQANLSPIAAAATLAGDGAFRDADACVKSRVPLLANGSFAPKFYRTPEGALWMRALLEYMAKLPKSTTAVFLAQMKAMKRFRPDFDPSLALAVAFRESNSSIFKGPETVDSHKSGGLDFLGNNLKLLKSRYLPPGYGGSWRPSEVMHNESGQACRPALLPANELPIAYAADLLRAKDQFEKAADQYGFSARQIAAASPTARRAWIALTFGMSGGPEFKTGAPMSFTRLNSPGTVTALTHLKALIAEGQAKGLDDILTSKELQRYTNVRLALASAANAGMIEVHAGLGGE